MFKSKNLLYILKPIGFWNGKDHEQPSWPSNFNHYLDQLDFSRWTATALSQNKDASGPKVAWTKHWKTSGVCGKINGFGTPIGTGWDKFIGTSLNDDMINRINTREEIMFIFLSSEESNDFDVNVNPGLLNPYSDY